MKDVRLIDANALDNALAETGIRYPFDKRNMFVLIENAPTIDPESLRPHGEWVLHHVGHGHYWECSVCHTNPCIYVTKNTKFCPNCGAKMDLED